MAYDKIAKAYLSMLQESTQFLSENMLMEDRIDYLKKNVKTINSQHDTYAVHRTPEDIIDFLADKADPSKKKVHTQHLIRMYNSGAFRQEDAPRVRDALSNFDKYKAKLPEDKRDIGRYSRISEIETAVAPHIGTPSTKAEEKQQLKQNLHIPGKHELKYDDENISIYHVKDEETSQKLYGSKTAKQPGVFPTEWCTAWSGSRECQFKNYQKSGNLFTVHRKSDGAVFQYHPKTNQFMNSKDDRISTEDFDTLKASLHKAWAKDKTLLDM